MPASRPLSIIVPAHNEELGIDRLLAALVRPAAKAADLEILVVCNGCTDRTAEVARRWAPEVRVLEIPVASKPAALSAGNAAAAHGTRVYCDADILIAREDVRRLVAVLDERVLAAGPARIMDLTGASWIVKAYYRIWERLPQVRADLFGRGVIALSEAGVARVAALPSVLSDDLAVSEAFAERERRIVGEARATIVGPRTLPDLLRRRARVVAGTGELDRLGLRKATARTGMTTVARLVCDQPGSAGEAVVFLAVTLAARTYGLVRRLRGTSGEWLRDESSRRAHNETDPAGRE